MEFNRLLVICISHPLRFPLLSNGSNKDITRGFDDSSRSQYLYAKSILDRYGFKDLIFHRGLYLDRKNKKIQSWKDIAALERNGMNIESHIISHTGPFSSQDWVF